MSLVSILISNLTPFTTDPIPRHQKPLQKKRRAIWPRAFPSVKVSLCRTQTSPRDQLWKDGWLLNWSTTTTTLCLLLNSYVRFLVKQIKKSHTGPICWTVLSLAVTAISSSMIWSKATFHWSILIGDQGRSKLVYSKERSYHGICKSPEIFSLRWPLFWEMIASVLMFCRHFTKL